jgi:hypothetical protein
VPDSWIDPGRLQGDELTRWYLRSPAEIEQERQAAATRRYQDFFHGPLGTDPDPGFAREAPAPDRDVDPEFAVSLPTTSQHIDPGFTWVPAGPDRFRGVRLTGDGESANPSPFGPTSYDGPTPSGELGAVAPHQDAGPSDISVSEPDLTPRPVTQLVGELRGPPAATFGPARSAATQAGPRASADGRFPRLPATPVLTSAANRGPQTAPASGPRPGQTIAYGALRAPAPSDQELAELRRQQAAFADTTRKIDLQNSLFAAPVLAAPLAVMGLEGVAAWAARSALPEAEQAALQFVEREPYLRVGDNWATRAGRRAHAALKERLAQKPGWEYEPKLPREGQRPLKPDMGTPPRDPIDPTKRKYIELKPDSPSGRAAGARALERYRDVTKDPVRLLFYNLKDFI